MIVIVAPEPVTWLRPLVAQIASDAPDQEVTIFAPWALEPIRMSTLRWLPRVLRRGVERRQLMCGGHDDRARVRVVTTPGFLALESIARAWERDDVGKRMTARFALRRAVDALAARWLPRDARAVYAPSCGAERVLAIATRRGLATTLVEDLPSMRRLHADLDSAARVHPECLFLRRFRASADAVARQEAERVLAARLLVRGAYARDVLVESGIAEARIGALAERDSKMPRPRGAQRIARGRRRVLLCGLATARNGSNEALRALERDETLTLLVRVGEGSEPRDLLAHPNVVRATKDERERLADVDAILAPAWCESYPQEIARTHALGIPVIATKAARGFSSVTREIAPGDVPVLDDLWTRERPSAPAARTLLL